MPADEAVGFGKIFGRQIKIFYEIAKPVRCRAKLSGKYGQDLVADTVSGVD